VSSGPSQNGNCCRLAITLVADVRSQPYSQWASQFNCEILAHDLQNAGVEYRFMAQTSAYQTGIGQLLELAQAHRVAVMCGEGEIKPQQLSLFS